MPESEKTVLLIEDHADIVELVSYHLKKEGFLVQTALNGIEGVNRSFEVKPDLILLDIMLPELDGLQVCGKIRSDSKTKNIPIIMLTAKGEEEDIVSGLEAGADDYMTKPFKPKELLARIQAVLRRTESHKTPGNLDVVERGAISVNSTRHEAFLNKQPLTLTRTEFRLLRALISNPGRVFTRDQLIDQAAGQGVVIVDRNIDVHVSALRKKLGDSGSLILTIRGVGYRFQD